MYNFAIVGIRLLAIWAFIKGTVLTQYLPHSLIQDDDFLTATGLGIVLSCLIYLGLSILLYFKAPGFAKRLTEGLDNDSVPEFEYQKLSAVLFSSAGILIFFWSIDTFIHSIGSLLHYRAIAPLNPNRIFTNMQLLIFGGGIQMIFGAGLFLGGRRLARWWNNFRDYT